MNNYMIINNCPYNIKIRVENVKDTDYIDVDGTELKAFDVVYSAMLLMKDKSCFTLSFYDNFSNCVGTCSFDGDGDYGPEASGYTSNINLINQNSIPIIIVNYLIEKGFQLL